MSCGCRYARKGEEIRELKKSKPSKAELQPHIDILVGLKAKFQELTGKPYAPSANGSAAKPSHAPAPASAPKAQEQTPKEAKRAKAPGKAPIAKENGRPAVTDAGSKARTLPPPPKVPGPLFDQDGKPILENLGQHLVGFSYVAG